MNGANKTIFQRMGQVVLVALLALYATSAPAVADGAAVAIRPKGTLNSGNATLTGTLTAPAGTTVRLKVLLEQFWNGQVVASAVSSINPITGTGAPQNWTVILNPAIAVPGTAFTQGRAQATAKLIEVFPNPAVTLAIAGATVKLTGN